MKNEVTEVLEQAPTVLQKYPTIGLGGGLGGGILYWIEIAGPILSFIGVCLGVGIAAITFYLKIVELKLKRRKLKQRDKHETK